MISLSVSPPPKSSPEEKNSDKEICRSFIFPRLGSVDAERRRGAQATTSSQCNRVGHKTVTCFCGQWFFANLFTKYHGFCTCSLNHYYTCFLKGHLYICASDLSPNNDSHSNLQASVVMLLPFSINDMNSLFLGHPAFGVVRPILAFCPPPLSPTIFLFLFPPGSLLSRQAPRSHGVGGRGLSFHSSCLAY